MHRQQSRRLLYLSPSCIALFGAQTVIICGRGIHLPLPRGLLACSFVRDSCSCSRRLVLSVPAVLRMYACVVWQGVAAMVRCCPYILGLDPEKNMEPKLAWLKDNLDLDDEMLVDLIKVCCAVLLALFSKKECACHSAFDV